MTWLDWAVAVVVSLGALVGLWKGAVRQIVGFVASLAAVLVPWAFTGAVARALQKPLDVPYPAAFLFCGLALSLIAYVVTRLVWNAVLSRIVRRADARDNEGGGAILPSSFDRLAGTVLGAGKSAVSMWIVVSLIALVVAALGNRGVSTGSLGRSELVKLSTKHNAIGYALEGRVQKVAAALKEQKAQKAPEAQKALDELMQDDRFQRIAGDRSLRTALADGDVLALVRSPELLSMVNDGEAMKKVKAVVAGATRAVGELK